MNGSKLKPIRSRLSINTAFEINWFLSRDLTCQPNCTTTKTTSGPHDLTSLVPADMVSLIGDISSSLHPLEKRKKKRILIYLSTLKSKYIFLAVTILHYMPKARKKIKSFLFFIVPSMVFSALPINLINNLINSGNLTNSWINSALRATQEHKNSSYCDFTNEDVKPKKSYTTCPSSSNKGVVDSIPQSFTHLGPTTIPCELNRVPTLTGLHHTGGGKAIKLYYVISEHDKCTIENKTQ